MTTPSPSASPKPKWSTRMGGALRRTSTLLSIRPPTPGGKDSDNESIKSSKRDSSSKDADGNGNGKPLRKSTSKGSLRENLRRSLSRGSLSTPPTTAALSPPAHPVMSSPSPIAESPMREQLAMQQDILGPSPLSRKPDGGVEGSSPTGYVPPPTVDSSVGNPGAFTDEPEELPASVPAVDPYASTATGPAQEHEAATIKDDEVKAEVKVEDKHEVKGDVESVEAPQLPQTSSYFDKPIAESMKSSESLDAHDGIKNTDFAAAVEELSTLSPPAETQPKVDTEVKAEETQAAVIKQEEPVKAEEPAHGYEGKGEAASFFSGAPSFPIAEPYRSPPFIPEEHEVHGAHNELNDSGVLVPTLMPPVEIAVGAGGLGNNYNLGYAYGHDVWGGVGSSSGNRVSNGHGNGSIKMPNPHDGVDNAKYEDPFADPVPAPSTPARLPVPAPIAIASSMSTGRAEEGRPLIDPPFQAEGQQNLQESSGRQKQGQQQLSAEAHQLNTAVMPLPSTDGPHLFPTIVMPLPPRGDVIAAQSMQRIPSHLSNGGARPTDERIPLLARAPSPRVVGSSIGNGHGHTHGYLGSTHGYYHNDYNVSATGLTDPTNPLLGHTSSATHLMDPSSTSTAYLLESEDVDPATRLIDLGWVEYALPDGSVYYSHLTRRTTTDLDLRNILLLKALEEWMRAEGRDGESMGVDLEGWIRLASHSSSSTSASGASKKTKGKKPAEEPVILERWWVDHHHRSVVKEVSRSFGFAGRGYSGTSGNGYSGKGKKQAGSGAAAGASKAEEDQLDLEYRYWAYMSSHPAHLPTSQKARMEAQDVLTWAWTDGLLPSSQAYIPVGGQSQGPGSVVPAPFGKEECQELMSLMRTFTRDNEHGDNGIQTRVISRILLRVAHWRQQYFRPNKPLPKDVEPLRGIAPTPPVRRPIKNALLNIFVSCICLGIPYLFLERARLAGGRPVMVGDEESGMLRGHAPMLIVGAATAIVAAIMLSVSVTFLSLPGLDSVARTAVMVAVVFASYAMAALGLAVVRYRKEGGREAVRIGGGLGYYGGEGLLTRGIALSLPTVFLAYSIVAFISGFVLYTWRGIDKPPTDTTPPFEIYTRWAVVGATAALAGVLTTSYIILRK